MNNVLENTDFLILLLYYAFLFLILKQFVFPGRSKNFYLLMLVFWTLKTAAIVIYTLLSVYYWKLADSISVYSETQNLIQLIKRDWTNISLIFMPVTEYDSTVALDNTLIPVPGGSGLESNFMLTRVCAIFYPLALGKYLIINLGFSFISALAQLKVYETLSKLYPDYKNHMAICTLFVPMVLFYGSPVYKETLCIFFIGFGLICLYNIFKKRRQVLANTFIFLVLLFLLYLTKQYFFYAAVIAFLLSVLTQYLQRWFSKSTLAKVVFLLLLIGFTALLFQEGFLSYFDKDIVSFVDKSNLNQQLYGTGEEGGSSFDFGEIETTTQGVIKKSPLAFYTTFFRPHLWEAKNVLVLITAMESLFTLLFLLYLIATKPVAFIQMIKNSFSLRFIFFFFLIMGIIIGLTTFNFGTITRYKAPAVPFLWFFLFRWYAYREIK